MDTARTSCVLLTAHRVDLVADRVRLINRLRTVLTGCRTPAAISSARTRRTAWSANRGVRGAVAVAATALGAAQAQQTVLPEDVAARAVADPAGQILALDERLKGLDRQIRDAPPQPPAGRDHDSLPGVGPILEVEVLVAVGDLPACTHADHLASAAGLVPVPRDSGRRTGNLHWVQAVIALARRGAGVLWALPRDNRVFTFAPPVGQTARLRH